MRFPPQFLDDIRARVPLSSVIGRRVAWDRRKTNAAKGDYWACCPFHGEKTPSFHADDRKGRYHCFGCKVSGDIFTFLTEKEGVPFPEAVERLAQEAGLPMPVVSAEDEARAEKRTGLYEIMELAAKFFEAELQGQRGAKARGYLADRKLPITVQKDFRLGYAPDDRQALRSHLADRGATVEQMAEAGLVISGPDIPVAYDRFRDRVMFPISDPRGRVIAFGGRALRADVPAKYLNSPETSLFHKGRVLYNHDKARVPAHETASIIAVEGYMDVIALTRAGLAQAVAPLGTALTEDQLALLWRAAPEPILCFDGDAAGLKAAARALDLALPLLKPGHSLRFALLPEGKDPDDLLNDEGPAAVQAVISAAQPLSDVLWTRALSENDRATPERRAQFERDLRQLVGQIGDETVRKHYLSDMGARLQALWQKTGQAAPARGPRRQGQPWQPRLKPGQKPWEVALPPSPQLKAIATQSGFSAVSERRERLMLLTVVNHPGLVHDFLDALAALPMASRELDSLRAQILDSAVSGVGLEQADLRNHLIERGHGPLLDRLEAQAKLLNEWFLGPGAAQDDARTGLRQMIALHRKTVTLVAELRAAEAAFAADPTDETLQALAAVREELQSLDGTEAHFDGFGIASGRPSDPIT
jgi:DNA primase